MDPKTYPRDLSPMWFAPRAIVAVVVLMQILGVVGAVAGIALGELLFSIHAYRAVLES